MAREFHTLQHRLGSRVACEHANEAAARLLKDAVDSTSSVGEAMSLVWLTKDGAAAQPSSTIERFQTGRDSSPEIERATALSGVVSLLCSPALAPGSRPWPSRRAPSELLPTPVEPAEAIHPFAGRRWGALPEPVEVLTAEFHPRLGYQPGALRGGHELRTVDVKTPVPEAGPLEYLGFLTIEITARPDDSEIAQEAALSDAEEKLREAARGIGAEVLGPTIVVSIRYTTDAWSWKRVSVLGAVAFAAPRPDEAQTERAGR